MENPWRGNVRELENTIERAVALCKTEEIVLENFIPLAMGLNESNDKMDFFSNENTFSLRYTSCLPKLDEVIHRYLEFAVHKNGGARDKTAKEIGIDRKTLYKRIKPDENDSLSKDN